MSISGNASRVCYTGDGQTCDFDFPFRIWDKSQLQVLVADAAGEQDVTWDAAISIQDTGGRVHFSKAPASGATIAILRSMPFTQTDSYIQGARFDPAALEDRLDQDCAERQQLLEMASRAVKMPATSSLSPEEYQAQYFADIETSRVQALAQVGQSRDSAIAEIENDVATARQLRNEAANAESGARDALQQVQDLVAKDIAQALRQSLNAAACAKGFAADVEASIEEAAEKVAACLASRMEGFALICQNMAASAAQSSCEAAANGEKTWLMVRKMTAQAGREAVSHIIGICKDLAHISHGHCAAAAASSDNAATIAATMMQALHSAALEAANKAAGDVADCLTNICAYSAEISATNAHASAADVKVCASIAADMQKNLMCAADDAANKAAESVAACCQEICNACVELAITNAHATAASARVALAYAQEAKQTDICLEAEARRAKDEELEKKIQAIGENCCAEALKIADEALELAGNAEAIAGAAQKEAGESSAIAWEARDIANASLSQSESAMAQSQAANETADNAEAIANAAFSTASSAMDIADAATSIASTAKENAASALEAAKGADVAATEAKELAQGANAAASSASETAQTANATAANAETVATDASATASAARELADTANQTSSSAKKTAEGVAATADTAMATADAAAMAAASAQNTASGAKDTADKALNAANEAKAAIPQAATVAPKAHGTAAVGTSAKYAREDHVHPSNNTDTHWTTHLYAGSGTAANAATTNGNTKLTIADNSTVRNSVTIKGAGAASVASDANGNITITGTNTTYGVATQTANGLMTAADKKKVDGLDDSNLVHKTGAEIVGGAKNFSERIEIAGTWPVLVSTHKDFLQRNGQAFHRDYIFVQDSDAKFVSFLSYHENTDGARYHALGVAQYFAHAGDPVAYAQLDVCSDAGGRCYGRAPSPAASDGSNLIATCEWVRNLLASTASIASISEIDASLTEKRLVSQSEAANIAGMDDAGISTLSLVEDREAGLSDFELVDTFLDPHASDSTNGAGPVNIEIPLTKAQLMERLRGLRNLRLLACDSEINRLNRSIRLVESIEEQRRISAKIANLDAYAIALCDLPNQAGAPWDGGGSATPWPPLPEI